MTKSKDQASFLKAAFIIAAIASLLASPVIFIGLQEPYSHLQYRAVNLKEANRLETAAAWIHDFIAREGRLPIQEEFKAYREHTLPGGGLVIYKKGELDLPHWGPMKDDFVVCASTGEWNLYYYSWNKEIVYIYSE